MLEDKKPENILFLDIETVPLFSTFDELPEIGRKLWEKKSSNFKERLDNPELIAADVYNRAGIYAEFGKIICISSGFIINRDGERTFRIKSFAGDNEKKLLEDFAEMLNNISRNNRLTDLCAHNGKEFDFPFIARRMLINGIKLPEMINVAGKKPWEVKFLDTLELWKFGDYKSYTSLELLTHVFEIPSPKDDIDGSMVGEVYWKDKDLPRIITYCEKDVLTVAQLFLRYKGEALIRPENVEIA
ncbi:MAG: 3'-5' exonuclease [Bacteroidota bacterium]